MNEMKIDSSSARRPSRLVLPGTGVDLVPLDALQHTDDLWTHLGGADKDTLWRYMSDGPFGDRAGLKAALEAKAASADPLFYAVVERTRHAALGYAALMRIDTVNRVIEVGHIAYSASLQQTRAATEAMYLLARYVFEELGNRRYEWKCNALNEPSRRAATRLGFTYEGLFRQHMIIKGANRDTAWFSMLDSEWPSRKAALERWLDPSNFDENERQRTSLAIAFRR
jgi:RimJ/RimL family protein N-acetyltransferase